MFVDVCDRKKGNDELVGTWTIDILNLVQTTLNKKASGTSIHV
jgi:hypothetical protein